MSGAVMPSWWCSVAGAADVGAVMPPWWCSVAGAADVGGGDAVIVVMGL
jgi:hypothetical protein